MRRGDLIYRQRDATASVQRLVGLSLNGEMDFLAVWLLVGRLLLDIRAGYLQVCARGRSFAVHPVFAHPPVLVFEVERTVWRVDVISIVVVVLGRSVNALIVNIRVGI